MGRQGNEELLEFIAKVLTRYKEQAMYEWIGYSWIDAIADTLKEYGYIVIPALDEKAGK